MKIPKKVGVMGRQVEILRLSKIDKDNSLGEWDPQTDYIKIKKGVNTGLLNETFWHEISHAVLGYTGVKQLLTEEQDEAVAQALGFALADILKHNFNIILEDEE